MMTNFFIGAYNAEKTLCRAIDSILNQTEQNFRLFVLDNGSTDGTRALIINYAKKDKRVTPLTEDVNLSLYHVSVFLNSLFADKNNHAEYFSILDADDEYKPDFLDKMLTFMRESRLNVATCGTDWIDAKTSALIRRKVLSQKITLEGRAFADYFPIYRNFMVTTWGGLCALSVLRKCDFSFISQAFNFNDTAFAMEVFRNAERAGILAESLHKYYVSSNTYSFRYEPKWFWACKNLLRISREYLLHYGEINQANEDYLQVLFLILLKYILPRIQNANAPLERRVNDLIQIFDDDQTIEHLALDWQNVGILTDKTEFLREQLEWAKQQVVREQERSCIEKLIQVLQYRLNRV